MINLRRVLLGLMLCSVALFAGIETASAQANSAPPNQVLLGRSFFFEWVVVGGLVGGALFAVCRSSRRV